MPRFSTLLLLQATLLLFLQMLPLLLGADRTSYRNRLPSFKSNEELFNVARASTTRVSESITSSSTRRASFGAGCCCLFFCSFNVFVSPSPSFAADISSGATLFDQSCSGCHAGGGNLFNSKKTLREADLSKNGFASVEQVADIVSRGRGQMPAYSSFISPKGNEMPAKLSDSEVTDVSAYVVEQVTNKLYNMPCCRSISTINRTHE